MHIPDGFLDTKTLVASTTLSLAGVGLAWRQTRREFPPGRTPLLGISAAFIFAAQMLNFPIVAGTSGHLTGAVLAAVLLGPGPAVIVMTSVLLVQCFMFADGGVLALGANVFNMGIVGTLSGYGVYRALLRIVPGSRGIAVAVASWSSVVLSSLCCAGELAWSGAAPPMAVFPAMAGVHALIGIGEGLITAAVIGAIGKARPDLLETALRPPRSHPVIPVVLYGCIIAVGLVLFVSPFASQWPDGLEHVARVLGFDQRLVTPPIPSPMPDYKISWISSREGATAIGGLVGLIMVFLITVGFVRMLIRKSGSNPPFNPTHPS